MTDSVPSGNTGVCTGLTPGAIYTIEVSTVNGLVDPATTVVDPDTVTSKSNSQIIVHVIYSCTILNIT